MDVDDLSGVRKRRRKKKTRKKRGGNIEEVNRQLRLLVDQVLQNHTRIQELEQWQEAFEDMELEERIMTLERQRSGTGGTGGGKRKKKTRKKRGGMDEQPTPPQVPRDNDVGTKQYEPGQLGVQQPPQIPPFVLPPPANTEPVVRNRRAAIRMERAPPNMIRSADERAMLVNRANDIYTRSQRSHLRNFTGDLMERCTGSRCGLGGRRRKKKTRKKRGGMEALRKRINKHAKKIDKNRQNLSNPEIRTSPITLPFIRPLTKSQSNFEDTINRSISPIVSKDKGGGKRNKKKPRKKKYKKRRTKKKSRKR